MKKLTQRVLALSIGAAFTVAAGSVAAETPKRGGILNFVVGSKIPSYDGHAESTFGMIHPIRPFYSLLIRINPENPQSPVDFVCDVCEGKVPAEGDAGSGGLKYTFNIRKNVKFHDGTPLTAADVVATFEKLHKPPEGVRSTRKVFFDMIDSVTATDDYTVTFNLKYPSGAFLGAIGMPFNFIYSKKDLDTHGYAWHQKNINGTGPFVFVQHQPGAFVEGRRYGDYHFQGQPYLDGFKAISAPKMSKRVKAIQSGRADIEFRGFPPKQRDVLVDALGADKITVQTSDWNCGLLYSLNESQGQFKDMRLRRAMNLSVDRWAAQKSLSQIAIVKTAAGIVFPSHPLAATKEQLHQLEGYWPDIKKSRAEAKKLLAAAGKTDLKFTLVNRASDQPYRYIGTWLIGEWRKVGVKVDQKVVPSPQWYDTQRNPSSFEAVTDANCQSIVNPLIDVSKLLAGASNNRSYYEDADVSAVYAKLTKAGTLDEQRPLMREYERLLLNRAHAGLTLWWNKINPHASYVKGWKIAPSHYLNQHLDNVWLDK